MLRFRLEHQDIGGPLNLAAPSPVRGREFAALLGAEAALLDLIGSGGAAR